MGPFLTHNHLISKMYKSVAIAMVLDYTISRAIVHLPLEATRHIIDKYWSLQGTEGIVNMETLYSPIPGYKYKHKYKHKYLHMDKCQRGKIDTRIVLYAPFPDKGCRV